MAGGLVDCAVGVVPPLEEGAPPVAFVLVLVVVEVIVPVAGDVVPVIGELAPGVVDGPGARVGSRSGGEVGVGGWADAGEICELCSALVNQSL